MFLGWRTHATSVPGFKETVPATWAGSDRVGHSSGRRLNKLLTCCQAPSPWYNRSGWLGVKHQVTYCQVQPVPQKWLLTKLRLESEYQIKGAFNNTIIRFLFWIFPPISSTCGTKRVFRLRMLLSLNLSWQREVLLPDLYSCTKGGSRNCIRHSQRPYGLLGTATSTFTQLLSSFFHFHGALRPQRPYRLLAISTFRHSSWTLDGRQGVSK